MKIRSEAILALAALTLSVSAIRTESSVVQWRVEDGGNGHYYDIIVTPLQSWLTSKA